ncbi:peptide MFS transporter [Sphingopyxis panaciterrae]
MREDRQNGGSFFGHPRGLGYLAFTEVWEGFSFYGMQALLMLYMVQHLLLPGAVENVHGLAALRSFSQGSGAPLSNIAFASQIFGLYAGLVNMTPLLGGWIGDRLLGQSRTIVAGALLMIAGHLTLMVEALFLPALLLLIFGAGFIKGNMAVQIGNLYGDDDPRRARGFGVYMLVRNIGAFSAPLVCGTLGERFGWHYGFGVAAIAMLLALAIYLSGRRHLPPERRTIAAARPAPLSRNEWRRIVAILLLFFPFILMFAAAYQAYTVLPVWVADHVDRNVGIATMPVSWIFTFDGLATMAGILIGVRLWAWLAKAGREPDEVGKIAIGSAMTCAAFALLAAAAWAAPATMPLIWLAAFFVILDFSFIWGDPALKAFVSRHAPKSRATLLMSLAIMSVAIANFTVGWLARFYEPLGPAAFWAMHAMIAAMGVAAALLLRPYIRRLVQPGVSA